MKSWNLNGLDLLGINSVYESKFRFYMQSKEIAAGTIENLVLNGTW